MSMLLHHGEGVNLSNTEYMTSLNELPVIPVCQSLCGDDDYDISWESFFGSLAAVCLESSF